MPRILRLAVLVPLSWASAACATLPALQLSAAEAPREPITILGPDGPVAESRAARATEGLTRLGADNVLAPYLALSEQLIGQPLILGNRVDLLVDGPEAYGVMLSAIARARASVDIESYIIEEFRHREGRFTQLLRRKHAEGVAVRVLTDAVGSISSDDALEELRNAGIPVCIFNPISTSWFWPSRLNHRDHRKIVVVDGVDAYAGGINFSQVYGSSSAAVRRRPIPPTADEGWRDTHVRIRGPGAGQLAALFEESWEKQECPGKRRVPPPESIPKAGETVVQIVPSSPDSAQNLTYISAVAAVTHARKSIAVTMAYFVPDDQLEEALLAAAARGVQVRMIVPGFSDFSGAFHAGRGHYERLLEGGVELYEQASAFLHAKTVVVDGIWSAIGSTNWDWRSFLHNDEVTVVVIDEGFAAEMMALFRADLANSRRITLEEWRRRPLADKLRERFWLGFQWLF